tara:strand:- start:21390 stop:22487 length:1098 start_codon:yes stop_codon:yes gene_type:complete
MKDIEPMPEKTAAPSDGKAGLAPPAELKFPHAQPPENGKVKEIAPGILWLRMPLPFQLDHVNIYLIRDGDGWAVLDTGISNDVSKQAWQQLLGGELAGEKLTRVIVTHFHPDHIGLAGWLCAQHDIPLLTSYSAYLGCQNLSLDPKSLESRQSFDFYMQHGMSEETATLVSTRGHEYLHQVEPLPTTYLRLLLGDMLTIGDRRFRVLSGDGHAPEQIMLYCEEDKLFFAADQVIARISPNISVWAGEPNGDPLGHYLRSLRWLSAEMPGDVLVLPGHQLPFYGLHTRCAELVSHHEFRCDQIMSACAERPRTVAELVPVLFPRPLDPHQMSFAFTETLAHANRLARRGDVEWEKQQSKTLCRLKE